MDDHAQPHDAPPAGIAADLADPSATRYRLWEIDPHNHCSIIGTCLPLDALRRIIRRAGTPITSEARDYDIHRYFVSQSGCRSPLTKLIHKALDQRYATQIGRFRRAASADELVKLWQQSMASGDVAGGYWAFMTHRATTPGMRVDARNDVHMLSHLLGKSSQDDTRRLRQLEAACAALSERLAAARRRADAALQDRDARIKTLEAQLAALQAMSKIVALPRARPEAALENAQLGKLRERVATLERRLDLEKARARAAEEKFLEIQKRASGEPARPYPGQVSAQQDDAEELPPSDEDGLRGHTVLYVGGYPNVTPHLRDQVEAMQGKFLYHDGGIEIQNSKLPGLVSQADAVFCPVVCVSHDAFLRLKYLCRRRGKRFILLQSAGLSSFQSAVRELARGLRSEPAPFPLSAAPRFLSIAAE